MKCKRSALSYRRFFSREVCVSDSLVALPFVRSDYVFPSTRHRVYCSSYLVGIFSSTLRYCHFSPHFCSRRCDICTDTQPHRVSLALSLFGSQRLSSGISSSLSPLCSRAPLDNRRDEFRSLVFRMRTIILRFDDDAILSKESPSLSTTVSPLAGSQIATGDDRFAPRARLYYV